MNEHLLQSKTWQKYEELEGHKTYFEKGDNYHFLAIEHQTPFGNYLFCPYGPEVADKKALEKALKALKTLGNEKNATFIRIEPRIALGGSEMAKIGKKLGVSIQKSKDIDPAHTWHLDLTQKEDDILENIESRKVRYWRNHEKKGISLRTSQNPEDITILTKFLKNLGEVDNFTPQDENHLKNQLKSGFATLYIADLEESATSGEKKHSHEGAEPGKASSSAEKSVATDFSDAPLENAFSRQPIAAALIYDFKGTRYYAHAATDFEHRKLAAGTIILIQMILDAKAKKQKIYDFWGITTSEDKNHPWYGFTQYKKSFGGRQVDFAGTYDLVLNKPKYKIYQFFRKINRLKRRIKK